MSTTAAAVAAVATPVVAGVLLAVVRYVQRRQAHRRRVEAVTRPPAKPAVPEPSPQLFITAACWRCDAVVEYGNGHDCPLAPRVAS